jgi:hypothetical protein
VQWFGHLLIVIFIAGRTNRDDTIECGFGYGLAINNSKYDLSSKHRDGPTKN